MIINMSPQVDDNDMCANQNAENKVSVGRVNKIVHLNTNLMNEDYYGYLQSVFKSCVQVTREILPLPLDPNFWINLYVKEAQNVGVNTEKSSNIDIKSMLSLLVLFSQLFRKSINDKKRTKRHKTEEEYENDEENDDNEDEEKDEQKSSELKRENLSKRAQFLKQYEKILINNPSTTVKCVVFLFCHNSMLTQKKAQFISLIIGNDNRATLKNEKKVRLEDLMYMNEQILTTTYLSGYGNTNTLNDHTKTLLISTYIRYACLTKDKSFSLLAKDTDESIYLKSIHIYSEVTCDGKQYINKIPFHALITMYINNCVAKNMQNKEKNNIYDVFDVNHKSIVSQMIAKLTDKRTKNYNVINDKIYHVFVGTLGFTDHLKYQTYTDENGNRYLMTIFKNCLFDVYPINVDVSASTMTPIQSTLSWPERLNSIKYPNKVPLREMNGTTLNSLKLEKNCTISYSWIDENNESHLEHKQYKTSQKRAYSTDKSSKSFIKSKKIKV